MNAKSKNSPNIWIDADDAPELGDGFFSSASLNHGDKVIRAGRPISDNPKQSTTIRYSPEVLAAFKATGRGWQTRMNAALQDWLKKHDPADVKI